MTAPFRPSDDRLIWDQTEEVARGVIREQHMMPLSALGLTAVGWLYTGPGLALAWAASMVLSTIALLGACYWFKRQIYGVTPTAKAKRVVFFGSLAQTVVTGGHMPLFWVSGNTEANLVLLLIFMASAMLAVALTAAARPILIANVVFHALVCEAVLLTEGGDTANLLAMLAPLYFGALASSGARTYQRHREVLTLAQEREAMIDDLTQANHAKTRFLANMSHELRTPLNAILGFSEMMKAQSFGPHGSPKYLEYASDIHSSGAHLLDLINDLLDGARVDAGSYVPSEETFALPCLFDECIRLLQGRAVEKDMSLRCLRGFSGQLKADRRGIKQVVINLLANAVKFAPAGGNVALSASVEPGGDLQIFVRDDGPGIEAADLPRIFQSFGQGRHDVAERDRGVGLGLAIVKGIVTAHGGTIEARSKPGAGTTMVVRLPAMRVMRPAADVLVA
ncbi:MAG: HAMP domain-containing sensor histidine kinase [Micropepsaceae bacterium]